MLLGHLAGGRAIPLGLLNNRRIGVVAAKWNQLNQAKNDHASDYEIYQNLFHISSFGMKYFSV
jgi:hypothetical protein